MTHGSFESPALTLALALAAGVLAQSLARHLRVPGIVLLLGTGVVLGPDVANVVRPATLDGTFGVLIGFAVAVILFEGGMNLDLGRLRREVRSIRQLVTLGALVTALGGALAARGIMGWDWAPSALFGTLVIVTGPTVINPLLRRIRVKRQVATVLEAEGVLVDAIGAIVAVVALEVVISRPTGRTLAVGAFDLVSRLGLGFALGTAGGLAIAWLLRLERVVPEGLENVFTLALALVLFQASNALLPESGIVAVVFAGIAVGNVRTRALPDLKDFKEQLTVLLIGLLFVVLAADVRLEEVRALGWAGALTVLALMLVVRPLNVVVGTWGAGVGWREKAFLSWLAPRGIVAAAVSSLFAQSLDAAGVPGGRELRALVFLVIAGTVVVQGLSGGVVAGLLGLRRKTDTGYVVLGAGDLGRSLARALADDGEEIVLVDSSHDAFRAAQDEGLRVLHGSGLDDRVLQRAEIDGRSGVLAVTANDEINLLFARKAREEYRVRDAWVALRKGHLSVTREMVAGVGARVLFGEPRSVDLWTLRLERGLARVERWRRDDDEPATRPVPESLPDDLETLVLPLVVRRGGRVRPVDGDTVFRAGDEIVAVLFDEHLDLARGWLVRAGWRPVEPEAAGPASTPV